MSYELEFFRLLEAPLSMVSLRRIFLLMLRLHYSDPDNFGDYKDLIGNLRYNDELKFSTLGIELLSTFEPESYKDGQANIFLGFQSHNFKKVAINNYSGQNTDGSSNYHVMPTDSVLVLRHVANTGDQALLIGEMTAAFLFGIRPMLMQKIGLRAMDVLSVSDPKIIDKAPERSFQVDVSVAINFGYVMTTNIESHRIKKIAMRMFPEAATTVDSESPA